MNLSPSALNKLWQKQTKAAPQQTSKQSGGKEANSESDHLSFETFSKTLCSDYSSSRILESMRQANVSSICFCVKMCIMTRPCFEIVREKNMFTLSDGHEDDVLPYL